MWNFCLNFKKLKFTQNCILLKFLTLKANKKCKRFKTFNFLEDHSLFVDYNLATGGITLPFKMEFCRRLPPPLCSVCALQWATTQQPRTPLDSCSHRTTNRLHLFIGRQVRAPTCVIYILSLLSKYYICRFMVNRFAYQFMRAQHKHYIMFTNVYTHTHIQIFLDIIMRKNNKFSIAAAIFSILEICIYHSRMFQSRIM